VLHGGVRPLTADEALGVEHRVLGVRGQLQAMNYTLSNNKMQLYTMYIQCFILFILAAILCIITRYRLS
jgi:hypothetical protein